MSELNTVVKINGGPVASVQDTVSALQDRELYVTEGSNRYLYVGNALENREATASPVAVRYADSAGTASSAAVATSLSAGGQSNQASIKVPKKDSGKTEAQNKTTLGDFWLRSYSLPQEYFTTYDMPYPYDGEKVVTALQGESAYGNNTNAQARFKILSSGEIIRATVIDSLLTDVSIRSVKQLCLGKATTRTGANGCYGPTLPSSGTQGQIFFKIL